MAPERQPGYHAAWADLHHAAVAQGAHAWRFSALDDPDLFLEFLEFRAGSDPRADPEVRALLILLDTHWGSAAAEEWREVQA